MTKRLAVFASFSGAGGVERMLMNLLGEFAAFPLEIDLLTIRAESVHLREIPKGIRWLPLQTNHSLTAIPELAHYLRTQRPDALLAAKDRAGRAAVAARALSGTKTHISIRLGTNLSAALEERSPLLRWTRTLPMPYLYRTVDQVIAISEGVALDTHRVCRIPMNRIRVIRNPVITSRMLELAGAPAPHRWLQPDQSVPVIIGAGRLTRQKDFPTLVRAFAELRKQRPARLVILGAGKDRDRIQSLAENLGLHQDLAMPGFQENPYAWIANAALFVLSSRWEGSGNVLTEAMALSIPVVSTDCPSGPAEILQHGRIAPLVPVGDHLAMSQAMRQQLESPPPGSRFQEAIREYQAATSARHYLAAMGLINDRAEGDH